MNMTAHVIVQFNNLIDINPETNSTKLKTPLRTKAPRASVSKQRRSIMTKISNKPKK